MVQVILGEWEKITFCNEGGGEEGCCMTERNGGEVFLVGQLVYIKAEIALLFTPPPPILLCCTTVSGVDFVELQMNRMIHRTLYEMRVLCLFICVCVWEKERKKLYLQPTEE
jgi:hypothetical protein